MTKQAKLIIFCLLVGFSITLPLIVNAKCEGISSPANFSLYKNRKAIFSSSTNADYEQRYNIEWFIGSKSMGMITKKGGEAYTLNGSNFSSQSFSVTGSYRKNEQWHLSKHKIFTHHNGAIQLRFEDGNCDNSFETSPDLQVTINIK